MESDKIIEGEAMDNEEDSQSDVNRKLQLMGFMNLKHCEEYRDHVICGLRMFGDLFSKKLGDALDLADLDDSIKIMRYWSQLCENSALMYRMLLAKEKAEHKLV